jgi:hypothetical protein
MLRQVKKDLMTLHQAILEIKSQEYELEGDLEDSLPNYSLSTTSLCSIL